MRALMDTVEPNATSWADYTGAVSAVVARLVRAWPESRRAIGNSVRFRSTAERGKKFKDPFGDLRQRRSGPRSRLG
ncbi:hypothetical protein VTK26DRAFT_8529 [Humicola hyalothermophila]